MGPEVHGPAVEARLLAATIAGIRVHSVYVPNGRSIFAQSYAHKLRWLGRLGAHLDRLERSQPLLLCGDFNVAPDERDLYAPSAFDQDVIFHQDVRNALAKLMGRGLVDTFRLHNQAGGHYSWWDYRMLAFPKGRGLRIDLILASAEARQALHRGQHRPRGAQGLPALGSRADPRRARGLKSCRVIDSSSGTASKMRCWDGVKPANSLPRRGASAGLPLWLGQDGSIYRHVLRGAARPLPPDRYEPSK